MTTIRWSAGDRTVTWTEQDGFTGYYPLVMTCETIVEREFEFPDNAPGLPVEPGTPYYAGAVIALAARLHGVEGATVEWDPPPVRPPAPPEGVVY